MRARGCRLGVGGGPGPCVTDGGGGGGGGGADTILDTNGTGAWRLMGARSTPLRFVPDLYSDAVIQNFVQAFRDDGYAILPDVFQRETVAPFRASLLSKLRPSENATHGLTLEAGAAEQFEPLCAPRIRQVLRYVLAPSHGGRGPHDLPSAQLFEASLHRNQAPEGFLEPQGWHRDRGGHPAGEGRSYGFPEAAHVAAYFRDMIPGVSGATEIIEGSHRDGSTSPQASPGRRVAFDLRAQDVAVYDQRCYHRRGPFTARDKDDVRIFLNSGFIQNQRWLRQERGVASIPAALAKLWLQAAVDGNAEETMLLGGQYSPASIWAAIEEARLTDGDLQLMLDKALAARRASAKM